MPWLGVLLANLVGSAVARMLTGAGLGLLTFAALTPVILTALNAVNTATSGLPSDMAAIMLKSGFGVAMSAIGSAILTRAAIEAAKVSVAKAAA